MSTLNFDNFLIMKKHIYFFALCIAIGISACQSGSTNQVTLQQAVETAQKALADSDPYDFSEEKARDLVGAYENYVQNVKDANTPTYLFSSGELYRSLKEFQKEIDVYERLIKEYPDYEKAPQSLFLLGFCYENNLGNLPKAKEAYESFIQKHPKHQMFQAAEFSLKNLGRSPEDIIKEFEQKNKEK